MAWPDWSPDEPAALARYVLADAAEAIRPSIVRDDAIKKNDRLAVLRALYNAMLECDLHYSREKYTRYDSPQAIRNPASILKGSGNATCLDLSLLFAGVCLGHELLPLVVVVEGHAFIAVSMIDDPRNPDARARVERDGDWIDGDGVLRDRAVFERLISGLGGHYVPIECTGFAKSETLAPELPEGKSRESGRLSFEDSVIAARLQCRVRAFQFAIDPVVRQRVKNVNVYDADSTTEILTRIPSIFETVLSSKKSADIQTYEDAYLGQIAKKCGRVETLGVRDLKEFRQALTVSYVSLFVKGAAELTETESNRRSAEDVLESEPMLTIRAPAGAGKTTLLNWIALSCAQGANPEANRRWVGGIPFFVPLRALQSADNGRPNLAKLVDYGVDTQQWPVTAPDGWLVEVLKQKRAVIMLDGVDELPPDVRDNFWSWVDETIYEYPGNRIIITSRYLPKSRADYWKPPSGFVSADLDEMTDLDVAEFVRRWHQGAIQSEPETEVRKSLERARDGLQTKLTDPANRRVRDLCGTPLLCSLICALHWREEGYLPAQRIELYERCVAMLIEERDRKRGIEVVLEPLRLVSKDDKEMLLRRLAFTMMKNVAGGEGNPRVEVEKALVESWIFGWLPYLREERARKCVPIDVLDHLIERTGLLREPVSGMVEFAHRSFQEYLAACCAGADNVASELADRAIDDHWHEVIILSAGTKAGGIPFGREIITQLNNRGEQGQLAYQLLRFLRGGSATLQKEFRRTCFALAIACLETAKDIDEKLEKRVLSHLKEIVPPTNPSDATSLAAAGEAALPYLGYEDWKDEEEDTVAACARAVRLIGGPTAERMLMHDYGSDSRPAVLGEVARDPNVKFFSLPSVQSLLLEEGLLPPRVANLIDRIEGLQWAKQSALKRLDLSCSKVTDISELAQLDQLELLHLDGFSSLFDLTPLRLLKNLKTLRITACQSRNVEFLSQLQNLHSLSLRHCSNVSDISPISKLKDLRYLDLFGCLSIADVGVLAGNSSLVHLELSECLNAQGMDSLYTLTNLESLSIAGLGDNKCISGLLQFMQKLKTLNVSHCKLTGEGTFSALEQLTELVLSYPKINKEFYFRSAYPGTLNQFLRKSLALTLPFKQRYALQNDDFVKELRSLISAVMSIVEIDHSVYNSISCLPKLERLVIAGQSFTDFPNLRLEGLKSLNCGVSLNLEDIGSIASLQSLEKLNLCGCLKLNDIHPLAELVNLKEVNLIAVGDECDFTPLEGLENLMTIHIDERQISRLPKSLHSLVAKSFFLEQEGLWARPYGAMIYADHIIREIDLTCP